MSPGKTSVLVTGANRGIGRGMAEAFLKRPNHVVVAAVRDVDNTTLGNFEPASGSKLILVKIENTSNDDVSKAVEKIKSEGVVSLDVVVASAGINPLDALVEVKDMSTEQLHHVLDVNAFSLILLSRALLPLLESAASGTPKLVAISSVAGQIADMEATIPAKVGTYGVSKLALNYLVRRLHFENPWLVAWVLEPGFVQTDNGNATARLFGMPEAPDTLEISVSGLLARIDGATRSGTSGKFYRFDGAELTF